MDVHGARKERDRTRSRSSVIGVVEVGEILCDRRWSERALVVEKVRCERWDLMEGTDAEV